MLGAEIADRLTTVRRGMDRLRGEQVAAVRAAAAGAARVETARSAETAVNDAAAFLQSVAQRAQQALEYRVSELVTLALDAVFPEPYRFVVRFELRRGRTEADLRFERDGAEVDPLRATGGGAVDVAAFALRAAMWSLLRSRAVLVLDEPFRFVSAEYRAAAAAMIREVSERLGVQVVMVTHDAALVGAAARVFRVTQTAGISRAETEEGTAQDE